MKKVISVMVLFLSISCLVACGSKGVSQNKETVEINSGDDILSLFTFEDGYSGTIKSSDIDHSKLGKYNVTVAVEHSGNIKDYNFNVEVVDTTKPEVEVSEAKVKLNSTDYNLAEFIKVNDNSKENIIPSFDTSGLDTSKAGSYNVNYSVKDSSGNETTGELKVLVQSYTTTYSLTEMNEKIKNIIDSKYSEVFTYSIDSYTDKMSISFNNSGSLGNEFSTSTMYMTYYYPYMNVSEREGHGCLVLGTTFIYSSGNFLDNLYETYFYFIFNRVDNTYTDENIDTIYDLFKSGDLTFRMDSKNIKGIYPEGSFSEEYANAVIQMIDFYRDVEEQLDWKPSANYQ